MRHLRDIDETLVRDDDPIAVLVPAWRRKLLRPLVLVPLMIAPLVIYFGAKLPRWLLDHAHHAYIDCTNRIFETGKGNPSSCRQDATMWIPLHAPWTEKDARALDGDIDEILAEQAAELAGGRDLDRAAHDRATAALARARRPLVRSDYAADQELDDALRVGDLDGAKAAATSFAMPGDFVDQTHLGIYLCLSGDRTGGLRAFDLSVHLYAESVTNRLATIACGGSAEPFHPYEDQTRCAASLLGGGGPCTSQYDEAGKLPALVALHQGGDDDLARDLALIAPEYESRVALTRIVWTRWTMMRPTDATWPTPVAGMRATAAALESLIKGAGRADLTDLYETVTPDAIDDPATYLRWAAWNLDVEAATELALRGQDDQARAVAADTLRLARGGVIAFAPVKATMTTATVLDLTGDASAALDLLATLPTGGPGDVAVIAIQRAMILTHAGRFDDAFAAVSGVSRDGVDPDVAVPLAWLQEALALRLGRPSPVTGLPTLVPDRPPTWPDDAPWSDVLAYWVAAATGTNEQQRGARYRAHGETAIEYALQAVLPAVYYVLGLAAGTGDRELWLDTIASGIPFDPQVDMAARAEAARWADDQPAAALWDQRLAQWRSLGTDDRTAFLLRLLDAR